MFALLSAHWPNFCDVLVKVILGVMVLLIIACSRGNIKNKVSKIKFLINKIKVQITNLHLFIDKFAPTTQLGPPVAEASHLSAPDADDAIHTPASIKEEGDCDGVFAGRNPISFSVWVNLEDVSLHAE